MQHCLAVLLLDLLAVCLVRAASTTSATTTSMWDLQPWLHQASRKSASTVSAREGQGCRAFVQAVLPAHWAVLSAIMKSPGTTTAKDKTAAFRTLPQSHHSPVCLCYICSHSLPTLFQLPQFCTDYVLINKYPPPKHELKRTEQKKFRDTASKN